MGRWLGAAVAVEVRAGVVTGLWGGFRVGDAGSSASAGAGAVWSEQLGLCLKQGLWSGAAAVQVGCAKARIISLDSPCYFLVVDWLLTYLLAYLLTY